MAESIIGQLLRTKARAAYARVKAVLIKGVRLNPQAVSTAILHFETKTPR